MLLSTLLLLLLLNTLLLFLRSLLQLLLLIALLFLLLHALLFLLRALLLLLLDALLLFLLPLLVLLLLLLVTHLVCLHALLHLGVVVHLVLHHSIPLLLLLHTLLFLLLPLLFLLLVAQLISLHPLVDLRRGVYLVLHHSVTLLFLLLTLLVLLQALLVLQQLLLIPELVRLIGVDLLLHSSVTLLLFKLRPLLRIHVLQPLFKLLALLRVHGLLLNPLLLFKLRTLLRIHIRLYPLLIGKLLPLLFELLPLLRRSIRGQCAVESAWVSRTAAIVERCRRQRCRRRSDALRRQRPRYGDQGRASVVLIKELRTVLHGLLAMQKLRLHRRHVLLADRGNLLRCGWTSYAAVPAVIRNAGVVDVGVVDHRDRVLIHVTRLVVAAKVVYRAVVPEVIIVPVPALVAVPDIPEAIVHTAVKANVATPIAVVPAIRVAIPTPPAGRPQRANERGRNPHTRNVVVPGGRIVPVPRRPDVIVRGCWWLFIVSRKRWRCLLRDRHIRIKQRIVFVVLGSVSGLLVIAALLLRIRRIHRLLLTIGVIHGLLLRVRITLVRRCLGVVLVRLVLRLPGGLRLRLLRLRVAHGCIAGTGALWLRRVAYTCHLSRQQVRIGRVGRRGVAVHNGRLHIRVATVTACKTQAKR